MATIKTAADLRMALHQAPTEVIQNCLLSIILEATESFNGSDLVDDKELGADFINEVCNHIQNHGFWPSTGRHPR